MKRITIRTYKKGERLLCEGEGTVCEGRCIYLDTHKIWLCGKDIEEKTR